MPRYRCESCLGEYDDPSEDGVIYFHACPPGTEEPRDENIVMNPQGKKLKVKKEGRGRTKIV